MKTPLALIIMDGWGLAAPGPGNPTTQAHLPNINRLWQAYPHTQLVASGEAVGLPSGEEGNSETGHLNLGAGSIVFQDLLRIDTSITDGHFFNIESFLKAFEHVKKHKSRLHVMGLIGAHGVHSSIRHALALIQLTAKELPNFYLHLFTDGRDSPPTSSLIYINQIQNELKRLQKGKIASLMGRYYAMDRDNHWDRIEKAYNALVLGQGASFPNTEMAVKSSYVSGKTDEFIEPIILDPNGTVKDNDAVIFFNFRIDRPRELTKAFVLPDLENLKIERMSFDPYAEKYGQKLYQPTLEVSTFRRQKILNNLFFVTMTEYEKNLPVNIAFPPELIHLPLSRVISDNQLRQLHISETEKERFVTYYFNGQREKPFPGEEQICIQSPNVATYDQKPEMSAHEITEQLISKMRLNLYDFFVVNFANPDMVGHTGVIPSAIKACEIVDECVGRLTRILSAMGGVAVITSDHGNVEEMLNLETGEVDTEHSTNPVPFIVVDSRNKNNNKNIRTGILADVAPTILDLMNISKPEIMTGRSLLG